MQAQLSRQPQRSQAGPSGDSAEGVQVAHSVWRSIVTTLRCPHFSQSKKLGVDCVDSLRCIYDFFPCAPVPPFSIEPCSCPPEARRINPCFCKNCWQTDTTIFDQRQDLCVCQYCGETSIPTETPGYTRKSRRLYRPRKYSDNFYKRGFHFRSWLLRLQGKERRRVPGSVIDQVRTLLEKDGIVSLNYWIVRSALKHLGHTQYYNNCIQIMATIRGRPLFTLTQAHESALLCMFMSLRDVYTKVTDERINMLHYAYVIRKLCEIRGWTRASRCIPLQKSSVRIQLQDLVWKRICEEKGWPFTPTALQTRLDTRSPYSTRI